jgi:hypothetical protein
MIWRYYKQKSFSSSIQINKRMHDEGAIVGTVKLVKDELAPTMKIYLSIKGLMDDAIRRSGQEHDIPPVDVEIERDRRVTLCTVKASASSMLVVPPSLHLQAQGSHAMLSPESCSAV